MEIYFNKKTKAPFILAKELRNGILKLITPKLEIKDLKPSLFHGPFDEDDLRDEERNLLKKQQIEKYNKYKKGEEEGKLADFVNTVNDDWPGGLKGFINWYEQNKGTI